MTTSEIFATYPSLRDRVVVVSGGATGIGEAIVEAFAMQEAQIAFLDIADEAASLVTESIAGAGGRRPTYYPCDITDTSALRRTVEDIVRRFGTVDVLVNNAGNDLRHKVSEVTPEFWDKTIAVNLKQQFFFGAGSDSVHAREAERLHHQYELDRLGDTLHQPGGLRDSQGRGCRNDTHAGS